MRAARRRMLMGAGVLTLGALAFAVSSTPAHALDQPYCGASNGNVCQKVELCIDAIFIKTCSASFKYYAP